AAACDQVGNTAVSAVESLVTREPDRNGPTGGIRIEDGALFARKTRVRLSLWADDPSGVAGMRLRNAGSSWGPWERFAATRAWDLAPGDGEKEVQVRYRDNLGNESPVFQARIILDTNSPRIGDVAVNEVGKGAVEIAWRTDEPTFGVVRYGQAMRSYGEREDENRSLLPQEAGGGFGREHRVRLARLQPGRLYYAVIEAVDRAGNGASSPEFTFTAGGGDTNPPRGRIKINNGAEFTKDPQVTLGLDATDAEGAVTGMAFSADGRDWSREEPYRTKRDYTLTGGDGRKTVYVRFRDAAGNWSEAASDSIVLDTSPPKIGDIAIRTLDRDSVELAWRTSEPAWCEVRYGREKKRYNENAREKGSRADGQYGTEHRVVLERLKPNQSYYFIVTAYDRAGNESTTPEGHFDLKGQGGGDDAGGGAGANVALTGNGGKAFGTGKRAEAAVDGNYQTYWEYEETPGPGKSNSAPIFWMVTFARRTRLSSLKLIMSWGGCPFTIEYKQGNKWIKAFEVNGDNIASFQKGERGGAPCLEFNLGVQAEAVRLNWATRSKNVSIRLYEAEALAAG
ncbi:MAG: fibronectin type III domain-containing protein, partial [Patescibacteria group bacterium]